MSRGTKTLVIVLGVVAGAIALIGLVAVLTHDEPSPTAGGTTTTIVPTLRNYVGAPGSVTPEAPTQEELASVHDQVMTWLVRNGFDGYRVADVMAFVNNDYIAIESSTGDDAFELLAAPGAGWLMLEPPSLMWNTRYGMVESWNTNLSGTGEMARLMGGARAEGNWEDWYGEGGAKVASAADAAAVAGAWLAMKRPGEKVDDSTARAFPGYYTIVTVDPDGEPAGMISVNASTGEVWYHGWHGGYLADRSYD